MGAASTEQASTLTGAVFLSYASQDAEAAQKICETLRAAGIDVFLDQSELRGGDVWDERIRREINDCALFIPIISANTASRREGYFRLEWDLADQRSHMMARSRVFVMPVCLDATTETAADVPDSFKRAQWTRLPAGETRPAFVERVRRLLSPEAPAATRPSASTMSGGIAAVGQPIRAPRWAKPLVLAVITVVAFAAFAYVVANRFWVSKHATPEAAPAPAAAAAFNPPPHSIAVLPFVNMSGDKEQEYFSDGLSEELLNSLARITELQVAARTSSFYFKGEHADLGTIAHKLNVASVLEGSVRRSGHTIRVTAQLNNAVTGFHVWSQTYDRDLSDVLAMQTEIANAVAGALKVTLLGDIAPKIEVGGTRNPAALDAYLRGLRLARIAAATSPMECSEPIAAFSTALALDPNYALAYASRALITWDCVTNSPQWLHQPNEPKVRADAERAIALAPGLAEGQLALSWLEAGQLNLAAADRACARTLALAPDNDRALYQCSLLTAYLGHADAAISGARRGVALDPLNPLSHRALGDTLRYARRYDEAITAYQASIAVDPEHSAEARALLGITYFLAGNLALAQSTCDVKPETFRIQLCKALTYRKLARHEDAAAAEASMRQAAGDAAAYQYAEVHAQWGDVKTGLDWLEKAMRLRDPGAVYTKTDPLLDPLRSEPRFQAIERELRFPP
jgi:TolB-like protein/tetratricopeptide (TPR) repeat protein